MSGDFKKTQGGVSAGTDHQPVEGGSAVSTAFHDAPAGEQAPKGPGPGIGAGGVKIK